MERHNSRIEHVMKNIGITAFAAAALTSCMSTTDKDVQVINMKAKGPDYGINIKEDKATVSFFINQASGKGISYSIQTHKNEKGEISVYIDGETTYESVTNAKINENFKYVNQAAFEKSFTSDAENAIQEGWDKLIGDIIPGGIDLGDEWIKNKDKECKQLVKIVNNTLKYNIIKGATDTIVSRKGNTIETTIDGKQIKLINNGFAVETKEGKKADVYTLIADKKEISDIVVTKADLLSFTNDFKEEFKKHGIQEPTDVEICAIWDCLK